MKQKGLDYWEDFENEIQGLEVDRAQGKGGVQGTHFLFLGKAIKTGISRRLLSEKRRFPGVFPNIFD